MNDVRRNKTNFLKNKFDQKLNKRAQVTVYIIIAVALVVVFVLLFFFLKKPPELSVPDSDRPQAFIESCAQQAVEEAVNLISLQGGDIEQSPGGLFYNGRNVTYLCYAARKGDRCVNQRPLLIKHISDEINNYIEPRVENCFNILSSELGKKYDIELEENMNIETKLSPRKIIVEIRRDFKMQRGEEAMKFDTFKAGLNHPIYDLAEIAIRISNAENTMCGFHTADFMLNFPTYDVEKIRIGDSRLYEVMEDKSQRKFVFAIRSCVDIL